MIGSCVFMLINLIVTTVIFFSFFGALREISSYKMLSQYESMERVYYKTLNETESIEAAEQKTLETFLEFEDKNSWLWVKNVWRNDAKVNSIPTYSDLVKVANNSGENAHKEYVETISEEKYNAVTKSIQSENKKWNGYYIIAVLVVLTSLLSQFLSEKMNGTSKNKEAQANVQDPNQATMKMMKFILPAIILIFVLTNTASFGIYILVGNIISIVLNLLFGIFVKKLTQKEEEKYLQHIEREAIRSVKKEHKPRMVTYKNLGDRL